MPTISQRIASAFAVLCGHYGDVIRIAQDREQSRQSLNREAEQVAVDGAAAQALQSTSVLAVLHALPGSRTGATREGPGEREMVYFGERSDAHMFVGGANSFAR